MLNNHVYIYRYIVCINVCVCVFVFFLVKFLEKYRSNVKNKKILQFQNKLIALPLIKKIHVLFYESEFHVCDFLKKNEKNTDVIEIIYK